MTFFQTESLLLRTEGVMTVVEAEAAYPQPQHSFFYFFPFLFLYHGLCCRKKVPVVVAEEEDMLRRKKVLRAGSRGGRVRHSARNPPGKVADYLDEL
jgi:hypothetical protein